MSTATPAWLGVDFGSTTFKCEAFDSSGHPLASASVPTPRIDIAPGLVRRPFDAESIVGGLVTLLADVGPKVSVQGIGICGVAETGVLLATDGSRVGPCLDWDEPLTSDAPAVGTVPGAQLAEMCGLPLSPLWSAFKLRWLAARASVAGCTWLSLPDYLAWWLTGARNFDATLACRTALFDIRRRCWSEALVRAFGLQAVALPPVLPSGTPRGSGLSETVAAQTGIDPGTPVVVAGHDHLVARVGACSTQMGVLNSVGTAEGLIVPVRGEASALVDLIKHNFSLTLGIDVGDFGMVLIGHVGLFEGALQWVQGLLGLTEAQVRQVLDDASPEVLLRDPCVLPFLGTRSLATGGVRVPAALYGVTAATDRKALVRAVGAGITCNLVEAVRQLGDRWNAFPTGPLVVSGGGSRRRSIMEWRASLLGRDLYLGPRNGGTRGAAMLAACPALGGLEAVMAKFGPPPLERVRAGTDPAMQAVYTRYRELLDGLSRLTFTENGGL